MGINANIWNYRNGESIGFRFDAVRDILSTDDTAWDQESGFLTVEFRNPDESLDIYLGSDAEVTNHVCGIMVCRPLCRMDYLGRVFEIMKLGDVMMFYTDDSTPVFVRGADLNHYPSDLLNELGTPRFVDAPGELLHQTSIAGTPLVQQKGMD